MSGADQYASKMAYLQDLANKGLLTRDNNIWKELDGKRNVPEVNAFLNSIIHKIK